MIDYIFGKVAELSPTKVVIDNNGIGYNIEISLQTFDFLQGKSEAKVYIYHHMRQREDIEMYFGFASKSERELFEMIIGVSGVGVGSARMILSSFSPDELREAILTEDINRIKSVKGIGLKGAQRLILDLKDKIAKGSGEEISLIPKSSKDQDIEEAARALQMLGFSKPNINKAIQSIMKQHPDATLEDIIKYALKML